VVIRAVVVALVVILTLVMMVTAVVLAVVVMVLLMTGRIIGAMARYRHAAATDRHHACNRKCR